MAEKRLYQKIASQILEMIATGAYPPGTRLPGERELAEKLGVSRVVIRDGEDLPNNVLWICQDIDEEESVHQP